MAKIHADIYDYPKYYDLIFGSDWKAEYDFLIDCFERYLEFPVKRVFEPACGTGRLLFRLGKAGYEVSGLDLNTKSIEYCNARLRRNRLPESAFVGDMTQFRLKRPVDVAFNMINSFRHLVTEPLARKHFACMRESLVAGGIYILGLHLSPLVGETCDEESWSASRGKLSITSNFWLVERNLPDRYEEYQMRYDILSGDKKIRIDDQLRFRTYTAEQFEWLIDQHTDFEIQAVHDFRYDIEHSFFLNEAVEDAVFVLRAV